MGAANRSDSLTDRIEEWLIREKLTDSGDVIVVGFSGGGDSVCLLSVLNEIADRLNFSLTALHVHHGLRGKSADEDADFCRCFCEERGIPFRIVHVDVRALANERGQSVEEAARQERYRILEEERVRTGARWIVVAHHREDNAETVLANLFRGAGMKGLSGMEAIGVSTRILRPFLGAEQAGVSRSEIQDYLRRHDLTWRTDETNDEDTCTRNRIRHHILGYADAEINSQSAAHICQSAALVSQADQYLDRQARKWLEGNGQHSGDRGIIIDAAAAREEDEILQTYIIRAAIRKCRLPAGSRDYRTDRAGEDTARDRTAGCDTQIRVTGAAAGNALTDISHRHIEAVLLLLRDHAGAAAFRRCDLGSGLSAVRSYNKLWIGYENDMPEGWNACTDSPDLLPGEDCSEEIPLPSVGGERIQVRFHGVTFILQAFDRTAPDEGKKFPVNRYTKWMDYDKIQTTFVFRARRSGDWFYLPDGKKKSVKSYMIDAKIPASQRDRVILMAQGSHALLVGDRMSEAVKITADTERILRITRYDDGNLQ